MLAILAMAAAPTTAPAPGSSANREEGLVQCANLTYGQNKSSVCFSDKFLRQIAVEGAVQPTKECLRVDVQVLFLP